LGGDPARLRQILVNLIGNAVKFTAAGEVVVRVESVPTGPGHVAVTFTVSDTGIGIPQDKHASIFDPFTQADASTTRRFGGTGLGLTISARLVALMGGDIRVESDTGQGTQFHVTLPFAIRADAPAPALRGERADLIGLDVLVVDDNATNRRILEEILSGWGMRPTVVDGGLAAIAALDRALAGGKPFPLALIDFQMPDLDGLALAERIKNRPELGTTMIMMLSSVGYGGDATRFRELGVASYLTKPVRQSVLLDALLSVLAGKKPVAERKAVSRPELAKATRLLRVLVAEDNAVNTQLVMALLAKRGHSAIAVTNGRDAVAAVQASRFDIVLMDVQMPEMDGLEATAAIRSAEQSTIRHVPIIALTAHSMTGDREACLAAGADGYLSKPLNPTQLFTLIESLAHHHKNPTPVRPQQAVRALDSVEILARVDGDRGLLLDLAQRFDAEVPRAFARIRQSAEDGDFPGLESAAHGFMRACGMFGAGGAVRAAHALELMGNRLSFENFGARFADLERETSTLQDVLLDMTKARA
jgi:CheY-like chemotaxis protein